MNKNGMKKAVYLFAEHWGHCFVGSKETTVRWVFDVAQEKVIAGHSQHRATWEPLHRSEMADITESIGDNDMVKDYAQYGIEKTDSLPDWASDAVPQEQATA